MMPMQDQFSLNFTEY